MFFVLIPFVLRGAGIFFYSMAHPHPAEDQIGKAVKGRVDGIGLAQGLEVAKETITAPPKAWKSRMMREKAEALTERLRTEKIIAEEAIELERKRSEEARHKAETATQAADAIDAIAEITKTIHGYESLVSKLREQYGEGHAKVIDANNSLDAARAVLRQVREELANE